MMLLKHFVSYLAVVFLYSGGCKALLPFSSIHDLASQYNITLDLQGTGHILSSKFLSITIDSSQIKVNWNGFDFSSEKLQNLASALSPIDIRIGGTLADYVIFKPNAYSQAKHHRPVVSKKGKNGPSGLEDDFYLTGEMWTKMTTFFQTVGWDLIFDFNIFRYNGELWDPTNAKELLDYSVEWGIDIPGFQLGNEPNLYKGDNAISPAILAKDYQILKNLISSYPKFSTSQLFGPGVTNLALNSASWLYLKWFIDAGGSETVDEIGFHHYYSNGQTAKLADFLNIELMDSLKVELELALNLSQSSAYPRPVRLSETSSFYHGGAPNMSDRYVAGFLWLDKLGLASLYGLSQVFRQDFWGGRYSLVAQTLDPNPDYYLSMIFRRLIKGYVFKVNVSPSGQSLRVYAACANPKIYPQFGAIVLFYLNVGNTSATLFLSQFQNLALDLYQLTPGDSDGLLSKFVKLNGQILLMSGSKLPEISPKQYTGNVVADAQSFGFIVIPKTDVGACTQ